VAKKNKKKMAYILTITIDPTGVGMVQPSPMGDYVSPGKVSYPAGTTVTLTAIMFIDGHFDHWEGDVTGVQNPTTIVMNSDKNVTAVFEVVGQTYHLTTSVVGEGSVAPSEGYYDPGSLIIVVATPATGWQFDSWTGDTDGCAPHPGYPPNYLDVPMTQDRHITAAFTEGQVGDTHFRSLSATYERV
jgi:hypothetical protein